MRLVDVRAENYGVLHGQEWSLDPGFQVLYGPNEAGKSTLLQLLREALFGFPHRSPYMFSSHGGEMAATVSLVLNDGRRVAFRRRKGKQRIVSGELQPGGEPVDAEVLKQLLGSATADLFERVFAFSLTDLAAGEQNLEQGDLREALFGATLGGMSRFRLLQEELADSIGELYSVRARTRPKINRILTEIAETRTRMRDVAVRPQDYQRVLEARDMERKRSRDLRLRMEAIRGQLDRLERLAQARPLHERFAALTREQGLLDLPQGLPADGEDEFQRQGQRRLELREELAQLQHAYDNVEVPIAAEVFHDQVLAQAGRIKELYEQLAVYQQTQQTLPESVSDTALLESEVSTLHDQLTKVGWTWNDELTVAATIHNQRLNELEQQSQQLREDQARVDSQLPPMKAEIERLKTRLRELGEVTDDAPWQQMLDSQNELVQLLQREEDLQGQIADAERQMEQKQQVLGTYFRSEAQDLGQLTVPFESLVREFAERETQWRRLHEDQSRQRHEIDSALSEQRAILQGLTGDHEIPDRDQLATAIQYRNLGWQLLRQHYVDGQDRTEALREWLQAEEPLVRNPLKFEEAFEQAMLAVDEMFQRRLAGAEMLARQDQLRHALVALEDKRKSLVTAERRLAKERRSWQSEWKAVWHACHVEPREPNCMLEWLALYNEWGQQREKAAQWRQQRSALQVRRLDLESRLRHLTRDDHAPVEDLLRLVRTQHASLRDKRQTHDQWQQDLAEHTRKFQALEAEAARIGEMQQTWRRDWQSLLSQLGLPADWSLASARTAISLCESLRDKQRAATRARERLSDQERSVAQFERQVAALVPSIDLSLPIDKPTDTVKKLQQLLEEVQQAERERRRSDIERTRLATLIENKQRAIERIEQRRQELMSLVPTDDELVFLEAAQAASRSFSLARSMADLRRQIEAAAGNCDLAEFLQELESCQAEQLTARIEEAQEEAERLDQEYQDSVAQLALQDDRMQQWSGASQAMEVAAQLESQRGQLRDLIEEWAPRVLAQACMTEALERFEREHQPALLGEVNRLFSRMTRGRYRGVRRQWADGATVVSGSENRLIVETHDGEPREACQLSTGTREQLYLAVRLAFVQRYATRAEPLPLIMDDVLVNFDDHRAAETLEVIAEMGETHQILFLTCHESTVQQARHCVPDLIVHQLEQEPIAATS